MKYSICQADLEKDRNEIETLWRKIFNSSRVERYTWIYENNPSGPVICLLLKDTKGTIGATALFPRRIFMNGKYLKAGIAGDFAVDEAHRILGPALSLQKSAISNCNGEKFDILYGFPNQKSEPVLLRAGFKVLGEVLSLTKPLRSHYYLKKYIDVPIITKMFSKPIDLFMKIFSKESYYKRDKEYLVETPVFFDQRFDNLWNRVSTQFPIIGERTSVYLNWRFVQSPHKNYKIFSLVRRKSRDVVGYLVYSNVDNKSFIEDLLCLNMREVLDSLLSEFLLYQRQKHFDSISIKCMGPEALIRKLKSYNFSIRGRENKIVIYVPSDSHLLPYLLKKDNWYLMPGDNDV